MTTDRFARLAFLGGVVFLAFLYGVMTMVWKLPPYRFINRVQAGIVSVTKFEDTFFPQHMLRMAPEETGPDPVQSLAEMPADDLIVMAGGFFYRMDLCPRHGCIAYVIDRQGHVLHTWEADPASMFSKESLSAFNGFPGVENINVQGVELGPDGSLTVTFQGRNIFPYQVAVGRFSFNGALEWLRINQSHHWPSVGPDGRVYVPVARIDRDEKFVAATKEKLDCRFGAVFQEGVAILSPTGETLREFWMEDVVRESDRQGLAYAVRDDCDPYHVNQVTPLTAAAAAMWTGARTGDLLVSLRSSSALVILDQDSGALLRIIQGPMVAQHSPEVLPDGSIGLFDNLGGLDTPKGTRILRLTRDDHGLVDTTLFPRQSDTPGGDLFSEAQGAVRFSADGSRGLVSETLGGRVIEFDVASGRPLWIFRSVSDMSPYLAWKGEAADGPTFALLQTQGADYVSRDALDRWSALAALKPAALRAAMR